MLLRNFINSMSCTILNGSNTNTRWVDVKNNGTSYGNPSCIGFYANNGLNQYKEEYTSTSGSGGTNIQYIDMALGAGTTAPTIDDYKMENALVNVLTDVSHTCPRVNDTSSITRPGWSNLVFTQTVVNNTENPVTVTEIGLFGHLNDTYTPVKPVVLYTRDVISPVTIGVGETKTFVVSIDLTEMSTNAQTIVETE